jgi:hypothetical protein
MEGEGLRVKGGGRIINLFKSEERRMGGQGEGVILNLFRSAILSLW